MATTDTSSKWAELRRPFLPGTVGKLPKPFKSDSPKGKCPDCGGWHGLPAMHLDYAGHAVVTDRLNTVVGPENWSLEPIAFDALGNPVVNDRGELWCKLTILGVSKLCVGDGSTSAKQLIGDALRNGAMRFGVALDLWSKEELESTLEDPELKNEKPTEAIRSASTASQAGKSDPRGDSDDRAHPPCADERAQDHLRQS
jgi:hypothetical protein